MKKIIIVAVLVCAATFANAATVGWTCAGFNNYKNNAYDIFVIGQNGVTSVDQITALLDAGKDVSTYALGSGTINSSGAASTSAANSGVKLDAGNTYESFFVVFDNVDASKAGNYLAVTSEQGSGLTKTVAATASTFQFTGGSQASYANETKNWAKFGGSGVPEPTSAMLLVLGMAGLALRRKHA